MSEKEVSYFESELKRLYGEVLFRPEMYAKVRNSASFMKAHFSEDIELGEIAKAAFMSRFHFVRIFQQMYGVTPRAYLRDIRIEKAKEMLKLGCPVTEVCLAVGYQSLPTFSSVFRKCTSYSPKRYQQQNTAI